MRKILFRGKRTNNGEWVEGDLIHLPNGISILANGYAHVIPETVGQYTGLTDKNGKKIFEGNIVRYKKNYPCKIEYINFQFAMMWENFYRDFEDVYDHDIEVIGNVFDNPELLKGGAE